MAVLRLSLAEHEKFHSQIIILTSSRPKRGAPPQFALSVRRQFESESGAAYKNKGLPYPRSGDSPPPERGARSRSTAARGTIASLQVLALARACLGTPLRAQTNPGIARETMKP